MSAVLTAALGYAAVGWPVFLLGRSKRPLANCSHCPREGKPGAHDPQGCRCLTCHGFYAATRDPKAIKRMLALIPYGMLAIRTGAPSGLVVVDVDPRHGGTESLTELVKRGLCPPTRCVRTGNGGWHLYYRHPGPHVKIPGSNGKLAAGIDIKADGGYAAAPPSIHPDTRRPYTWVDQTQPIVPITPALITAYQQCATTTRAAHDQPRPHTRPGEGISYPDRLLTALIDAIDHAPTGRRRTTLYGSARGVARMITADAITRADALTALTDAGRRADQSERDIAAAIRGAFHDEGVQL